MTIVNTIVIVRSDLDLSSAHVAAALAAAASGSVAAAATVPPLLRRAQDRTIMLAGGALLACALPLVAVGPSYLELVALWLILGVGLALVQTPTGRLIQRSASADERAPLFAAQFALPHACWLLTYPVAGVLGTRLGLSTVAVALGAVCAAAVLAAARLWRPTRRGDRASCLLG